MRASNILQQAQAEIVDRAKTYNSESGERSMGKTVTMFNVLTGVEISEVQGWQFMEILKMVRSSQGEFKMDNFVDGAAYAALAGEAGREETIKNNHNQKGE